MVWHIHPIFSGSTNKLLPLSCIVSSNMNKQTIQRKGRRLTEATDSYAGLLMMVLNRLCRITSLTTSGWCIHSDIYRPLVPKVPEELLEYLLVLDSPEAKAPWQWMQFITAQQHLIFRLTSRLLTGFIRRDPGTTVEGSSRRRIQRVSLKVDERIGANHGTWINFVSHCIRVLKTQASRGRFQVFEVESRAEWWYPGVHSATGPRTFQYSPLWKVLYVRGGGG